MAFPFPSMRQARKAKVEAIFTTDAIRKKYKNSMINQFTSLTQKFQEQDHSAKLTTKVTKLPGDIKKIILAMACCECNQVPFPTERFVCPDGHMFCSNCGDQRRLKHASKCLAEIIRDNCKQEAEGTSHRGSNEDAATTKCEVITSDEEPVHIPLCHKQIKMCPADPIFVTLWMNTKWQCPNYGKTCTERLLGRDLLGHYEDCRMSSSLLLHPCCFETCTKKCLIKDMVEHLILKHDVYAMDLGDTGEGILYLPQSIIEARKEYYTILRCFQRFFLICVAPIVDLNYSENNTAIWIRRFTNKKVDDMGPTFWYKCHLINKTTCLRMEYQDDCLTWNKPRDQIIDEMQCLILPNSMLMSQLVLECEGSTSPDGYASSVDEDDDEQGYVPVKISIYIREIGRSFVLSNMERTSSMESLTESVGESSPMVITPGRSLSSSSSTSSDEMYKY